MESRQGWETNSRERLAKNAIEPGSVAGECGRNRAARLAQSGAAIMCAAGRRIPRAAIENDTAGITDNETGNAAIARHRTLRERSGETLHEKEIGKETGNQASRKTIPQHVAHQLHESVVTHFHRRVTAANTSAVRAKPIMVERISAPSRVKSVGDPRLSDWA